MIVILPRTEQNLKTNYLLGIITQFCKCLLTIEELLLTENENSVFWGKPGIQDRIVFVRLKVFRLRGKEN